MINPELSRNVKNNEVFFPLLSYVPLKLPFCSLCLRGEQNRVSPEAADPGLPTPEAAVKRLRRVQGGQGHGEPGVPSSEQGEWTPLRRKACFVFQSAPFLLKQNRTK